MKETYWMGKETEISRRLKEKMPSNGYTENRVYNAYIALVNIYYDFNNNGGCNIATDFKDGVLYLIELLEVIRKADIGTEFGNIDMNDTIFDIYKKLSIEDVDGDYVELELFADSIMKSLANNEETFK